MVIMKTSKTKFQDSIMPCELVSTSNSQKNKNTGADTIGDEQSNNFYSTLPEDSSEDESASEERSSSEEGGEQDCSMEEDSDSEVQGNATSESKECLAGNPGWADAMAKILKMKKPKKKKVLVLSRAKKDHQVKKKPEFEVVKEDTLEDPEKQSQNNEEPDMKAEGSVPRKRIEKHFGWERVGREKPSILEKSRERQLRRIATQGVVQLFNTFREQKKPVKLSEKVSKKKKPLVTEEKIDRRAFLDMLKGSAKSIPLRDKVKSEEQPSWSVLRDDFVKSAKMKDWDKEEEEDEEEDYEMEME